MTCLRHAFEGNNMRLLVMKICSQDPRPISARWVNALLAPFDGYPLVCAWCVCVCVCACMHQMSRCSNPLWEASLPQRSQVACARCFLKRAI